MSWCVCYFKGRSLRCSPGRGNAGRCAVRGGGAEREQWRSLHSPPDFNLSLCYPQSNWAPLVLVPEWVGSCTPQAPVVSPTTSLVRLGVSPAAPTPTGIFSQRFEAPFPRAGALGCTVCFVACPASLPAVCPVYLWANVVPRGATRCSACPALRHSESGPLGLSAQMWCRRVC